MNHPVEAFLMVVLARDAGAFETATDLLRSTLSARRRFRLALAALTACEREDAGRLLRSLCGGAGWPPPPLAGAMGEAAFWADLASDDELRAYAVACFNRLSPSDRAAFLDWAGGRMAA